jgi:hypothetical protein
MRRQTPGFDSTNVKTAEPSLVSTGALAKERPLGSRETTFTVLSEFDRVVAVVVEVVVLSEGAVELVHPASASVTTTVAIAPSLRIVLMLSPNLMGCLSRNE